MVISKIQFKMPTLRIHTHWQVAQINRTSQNKPKSMADQTLKNKKVKKHRHTKMAIRNACFCAKLKVNEN